MEHTLDVGDRVLVNRLAYRFGDHMPNRGDIIVFRSPENINQDLIKRVIAVGGDTIEIKSGNIFVNGEMKVEPFLKEVPNISNFPLEKVPDGTVFVMGDNRNNSHDSRAWKPPWLPVENIIGKAFVTYWPIPRWTWL
jgi:signal peptidase I